MIRRRLVSSKLKLLLCRLFSVKRGLANLLVTLALAGCAGGEHELYYPTATDYQIHGIDVSKYQGDIDWDSCP